MRPVLFYVPLVHLPIFSYGVMLGLSLIVGWYIVIGLCVRDGIDKERASALYMWTAVASVVSARLLYVLTNLDRFDNLLDIFKVWEGGLVAYGGFLGGFLFGVVYCWRKKIKLLAWADCVVPSLGSGLALTRIGCLLYGCDFGKPMEKVRWFALRFPGPSAMAPKGSPAWQQQLAEGLIHRTDPTTLPLHPTQLYEAALGVALFGLTMLVRRYRTFSGQMFIAFTLLYGVARYFIEVLRADDQRGELGPFSTSQLIGMVTFAAAIALFFVLRSIEKREPGRLRYWEKRPEPAPAAASGRTPKRRRRK